MFYPLYLQLYASGKGQFYILKKTQEMSIFWPLKARSTSSVKASIWITLFEILGMPLYIELHDFLVFKTLLML